MERKLLNPVTVTLRLIVNHDDRVFFMPARNELHRLLLHRLEVLEAALQRVEEIQRMAAAIG